MWLKFVEFGLNSCLPLQISLCPVPCTIKDFLPVAKGVIGRTASNNLLPALLAAIDEYTDGVV